MTTTKLGIGAIVTGLTTLAYAIVTKNPDLIGTTVVSVLSGLGLIQAKDAN